MWSSAPNLTASMRTLCTVSPNDGEAFCSRSRRTVASVLATLLLSGALHAQQAAPAAPAASGDARAWTTADDHRQMMQQLGITALRPGPSGNEQAPNAANYDEAKANPYPNLPPLLTLKNGQRVANARQWARRRAEIVEDFEREVIGRVPPTVPRVTWSVTATDTGTIGGRRVIGTQLVGHVDNSAHPAIAVDIPLTLVLPADAKGPVPVMIMFRPGSLPGALGRPLPPPPAGARPAFTPPPPAPGSDAPATEQLVVDGWGFAFLSPTSVQADNGGGLTEGIIGLVNRGRPRALDDWGALRAWAWGASRALDYFETDAAVDAKRVGVEGLSRYGKAALVAMAYDSRFAIAHVASSGAGGAKLLRRDFGERVENLASSGEYHWMAGNFLKYAGPLTPNDLPVDAHELVALCAPRPVFVGCGSLEVEGGWVDAKGMLLAAVHAGPVYRLLGKKGLEASDLPPIETPSIAGEVAFRQHAGGHTAGPNWPAFLTFASRYLGPPQKTG